MTTKLMILNLLLVSAIFAQNKVLKNENENLVMNENSFEMDITGYYTTDYKKKDRKAMLKNFQEKCGVIALSFKERFEGKFQMTPAAYSLKHSVVSYDLGKHYGEFKACRISASLSYSFAPSDTSYKFVYTVYPVVDGKKDKNHIETSNQQKLKFLNDNVASYLTSRITELRVFEGAFGSRKSYTKSQFLGVELERLYEPVVDDEVPERLCDKVAGYKVSISGEEAMSILDSYRALPYKREDIGVKSLGDYTATATNYVNRADGGVHLKMSRINEESQVIFNFPLDQVELPSNIYKLENAYIKFHATKSVRRNINNPIFNNTELLCLLSAEVSDVNLCSGRLYQKDWTQYIDLDFVHNMKITSSAFSDQVLPPYRQASNGGQYVEYNTWFNFRDLFGAQSSSVMKYVEKSTKAGLMGAKLDFVLTDDMYLFPEELELVLDYSCR